MAKPSGREIQPGMRSVRAKAAPMEMRHGDDDGDQPRRPACPQMMGQAPNLRPLGWATPSVCTTAP